MAAPKRSKYEMETIINYNQEEDNASCYTFDPKLIRKLDSYCQKSSVITVKREGNGWREYTFPKSWVKVHFPRQLSEKTKRELAERAKQNFGHEDVTADG